MENKQFPEKWCIRGFFWNEEDNAKRLLLEKGFSKMVNEVNWSFSSPNAYYYVNDNVINRTYTRPSDYTEITLEEFKKHILKEETMEEKKIIGYKLIKPAYHEAVKNITGYLNWDYVNLKDEKGKDYIAVKPDTECYRSLKNAGVLDLWFEPVYEEEELKVDDYIVILKEWDVKNAGKIAKITKILKDSVFQDSKWINHIPDLHTGGGFRWKGNGYKLNVHFRKATKEEIEEYNRPKLPVINGYSGRIEGDYIIYGSNCAKFHKNFFRDIVLYLNHKVYTKQNRKIISIKLDSGVELTIDQIKQIVEYINKN